MSLQAAEEVADDIAAIARKLSREQAVELAAILAAKHADPNVDLASAFGSVLTTSAQRATRHELVAICQLDPTSIPPQMIGAMLLAAQRSASQARLEQTVEIALTGPDLMTLPLRRTEQVLLDLIRSSAKSILLVSFAVYMLPSIAGALTEAARRGVGVDICVEAPEPGNTSIAYDTVAALGQDVRSMANVYLWPLANRPRTASGAVGALHAKCAVSDSARLLVTSANLTAYALSVNLELGVLISGGSRPATVADYFARLISSGTFVRLDAS